MIRIIVDKKSNCEGKIYKKALSIPVIKLDLFNLKKK